MVSVFRCGDGFVVLVVVDIASELAQPRRRRNREQARASPSS
jgi:hypothetical protein